MIFLAFDLRVCVWQGQVVKRPVTVISNYCPCQGSQGPKRPTVVGVIAGSIAILCLSGIGLLCSCCTLLLVCRFGRLCLSFGQRQGNDRPTQLA
jgi:hypothetical protein